MTRFRSRPTTCEAIQWTGDNEAEVEAFCPPRPLVEWENEQRHRPRTFVARTSNGGTTLWVEKSKTFCYPQVGDWIIREADGTGVYPCAADVFTARWEAWV